jgi:hypothetical protein
MRFCTSGVARSGSGARALGHALPKPFTHVCIARSTEAEAIQITGEFPQSTRCHVATNAVTRPCVHIMRASRRACTGARTTTGDASSPVNVKVIAELGARETSSNITVTTEHGDHGITNAPIEGRARAGILRVTAMHALPGIGLA